MQDNTFPPSLLGTFPPHEFAEAERVYGGQAAYEAAKAAGRTKLTYRQWVQVRTPAFKRWFGDWEAVAARKAIMEAAPVEVTSGAPAGDAAAMRAWAASAYPRNATFPNAATGRRWKMVNSGFKKLRSHSAEHATLRLIPGLAQLIERAIPIYTELDRSGNGSVWRNYAVRAVVDGEPVHIRLTTWQEKGGDETLDLFHDAHATASAALERENPTTGSPLAMQGQSSGSLGAGLDKDKLYQWWRAVNESAVSKVVDPETGEPLVVYHGTRQDGFDVFDVETREDAK